MKRSKEAVVRELKKRALSGKSLKSGENRGDWLYASAVAVFGSWGKAVEEAGFNYSNIVIRPFTKKEVIEEIKNIVKKGIRPLAKENKKLAAAAKRHYGSWKNALNKADCEGTTLIWNKERIIAELRKRHGKGKRVNSVTMMKEDKNLYMAGRRRFGTWRETLDATFGKEKSKELQGIKKKTRRKRRKI